MDIVEIDHKLEIPHEALVTIVAGELSFNISCTPQNLEEMVIGFLLSEGLVKDQLKDHGFNIEIENNKVYVDAPVTTQELSLRSSGSPGIFRAYEDELPRVSAKESYTLNECRNALHYLEAEEYKRTRGYHIAVLVSKEGIVVRAYDVGRHNAIDKVIGMGIKKNVDMGKIFLLVSGRISQGMVAKCVRVGIPLLVSKAAILDSAIEKCKETGLSAVSFATGIAVRGEALN
ncbi:MAG: formate dehydrogenase accessory sulfurtransferase FdhD [Archaeoglobaceae archaeon]